MSEKGLYVELIEFLKRDAELDKFIHVSGDNLKELYIDFPPLAADEPQQEVNYQQPAVTQAVVEMPVHQPQAEYQPQPKPQAEYQPQPVQQPQEQKVEQQVQVQAAGTEARPIAPSNIDLSSITTETLQQYATSKQQLYTGEHFTLYGEGNVRSRLMFIGEAQGRGNDNSMGQTSELLSKMITAMKFDLSSVYIADIMHSVKNVHTPPTDDELAVCIAYMNKQIELVKPEVIVFLGPIPLRLLVNKRGVSRHRGQWVEYMGAKVMPTFHPALLYREQSKKKEVWEDLKQVMDLFGKSPDPRYA